MGWNKIPNAFYTFLEACISGDSGWTENHPQNRAHGVQRKRVQNPPECRGRRVIFADFMAKTGQNCQIYGPESVLLARTLGKVSFLVKMTKNHQNGDLSTLFGREEGFRHQEMSENSVFSDISRPLRRVYWRSFPTKGFPAWWTVSGPGSGQRHVASGCERWYTGAGVHTTASVPKTRTP